MTGKPCSGKGTLANAFAEKYGFTIFKAGDLFKAEAARRGMSVAEFSVARVNDPSFDYAIDKQFEPMGIERANDNLIVESRVAWHFIPHSFKVFVDIDDEVMVDRLLNSDRTGKEKYETRESAWKALEERTHYDQFRYKKIYDIDIMDKSNFDFVLDSSNNTPEELAEKLYEAYQKFLKQK